MRVLVVGTLIDRVERGLFEGLCEKGFALELVCAEQSPNLEALRARNVPIAYQTMRSKFDRQAIRFLREKLAAERFDVVYALTARALTTVLWATRGTTQRVVTYRGTVGHLSRLDPTSYLGFLNPRIERIICVSQAVERYLLSKGVAANRLVTIYKGHDPVWYSGGESVDLSQFGIPPGAPVVGCTANMRPVKGVDILVRAFGLLKGSNPAHLLLIGEVRDKRLSRLVESLGIGDRVHFTGYRADAPQIVRSCQVFVMPSRAREGLPKAVIEAMSQGVPPIVTAVGGMPELVADGLSGLVVPPSDVRALAEAIERLVRDDEFRTRLGAGASARIKGEFSIARTIEATARVLQGLAPGSAGAP
jgi:glycosyltransferase involved in cell wall biosynthesis